MLSTGHKIGNEPESSVDIDGLMDAARSLVKQQTSLFDSVFNPIESNLGKMWLDSHGSLKIDSTINSLNTKWIKALSKVEYAISILGAPRQGKHFLPSHLTSVSRFASGLSFLMDYSEKDSLDLAIAGFTHDIGEIFLRHEILTTNSDLSENERKAIHSHPRKSAHFLKDAGLKNGPVVSIVMNHHERFDGSGYPESRSGNEISELEYFHSLCDVYTALINDRPHRNAYPMKQAMRMILSMRDFEFPGDLIHKFISRLGIYPPGCVVLLKGGGVALIMDNVVNAKWPVLLFAENIDPQNRKQNLFRFTKPEIVYLNALSGDYALLELTSV